MALIEYRHAGDLKTLWIKKPIHIIYYFYKKTAASNDAAVYSIQAIYSKSMVIQ